MAWFVHLTALIGCPCLSSTAVSFRAGPIDNPFFGISLSDSFFGPWSARWPPTSCIFHWVYKLPISLGARQDGRQPSRSRPFRNLVSGRISEERASANQKRIFGSRAVTVFSLAPHDRLFPASPDTLQNARNAVCKGDHSLLHRGSAVAQRPQLLRRDQFAMHEPEPAKMKNLAIPSKSRPTVLIGMATVASVPGRGSIRTPSPPASARKWRDCWNSIPASGTTSARLPSRHSGTRRCFRGEIHSGKKFRRDPSSVLDAG